MPQEIPADSSPASKRSRRHHCRTVDLEQSGCSGSIQGGVLQRKLPDLPDVRSPEALAAYLDARRLRYSRRTVSIGRAQAVEFEVAEVGLAVLKGFSLQSLRRNPRSSGDAKLWLNCGFLILESV